MNSRINPTHTGAATLLSGEQVVDSSRKGARRKFWPSIAAASLPLRLLYSIYERHLVREIERRPMPRHVGIILDGNRRHALQQGVCDPRTIYQRGAEKLDDVLDWCAELSIPAVTLWVFSTENFKRSPTEVSGILAAIEAKVATLAHDPFLHRKRVRVQTIGRLDVLPESVAAAFRAAQTATVEYDSMILTIAVAYGGREEIVDAVRNLLKEQAKPGKSLPDLIESITPETIARHLYAADLPDPDLIIRTSGEIRLSGFLLWQSVHSEFYFTDVLWPAFRRIDLLRAIRAYQARDRRIGR